HVDLARVDAFRLQEDLVPLLVRKTHDLVLERRAVPRTDAADLTVEQRRSRDVRANEIAHAIVGVNQVTVDLRTIDSFGHERERDRWHVAALDGECSLGNRAAEIDTLAIESWRRSGLQPPPFEPERLQRRGEILRRRFTRAARGVLLRPHV